MIKEKGMTAKAKDIKDFGTFKKDETLKEHDEWCGCGGEAIKCSYDDLTVMNKEPDGYKRCGEKKFNKGFHICNSCIDNQTQEQKHKRGKNNANSKMV